MDGRVREVNRVVKNYDRELGAYRDQDGKIHVTRTDPKSRSLVFSLTDTWQAQGTPREWGLEVIMARLRAIDLWKDETVLDRLELEQQKREEANRRDLSNTTESFLYDFRRQFAKATDCINTGTLEKRDPRAKKGA